MVRWQVLLHSPTKLLPSSFSTSGPCLLVHTCSPSKLSPLTASPRISPGFFTMSSTEEVAAPGGKWTGGVQDVALDCPMEAAWELCSDWEHWQRWWPGNPKCELREGENRKPSCLRYVELMPGVCNYERLLECDDEKHFMSYNLEENPFGWKGYIAKAQFRATGDGKTMVDWNYEVDAVGGYTADMMSMGMQVFYNTLLKDLEKAAQRLANGLDPKPEDTTAADAVQ